MKKMSYALLIVLFAIPFTAIAADQCTITRTSVFELTDMPQQDGTFLSDEYARFGIHFEQSDDGLPDDLVSQMVSNSYISSGELRIPYRIKFRYGPVKVSVRIRDLNWTQQNQLLYALDRAGNIIDSMMVSEAEPVDQQCTLTVSNCNGIAEVVFDQEPYGAVILERLEISYGR